MNFQRAGEDELNNGKEIPKYSNCGEENVGLNQWEIQEIFDEDLTCIPQYHHYYVDLENDSDNVHGETG